jgi:GNAT superfamily N-acetyltransferase
VPVLIRKAAERDIPLVVDFIRKLADYERMSDRVRATEADLRSALFGTHPAAEVLLAYASEEPAGFAVFFQSFSTFSCRPGIYLEDIFVEPRYRRAGVGTALMAAVARLAVESGGSLNWSVLTWNQPAIDFYLRLGAVRAEEWNGYRLAGDALLRLAAEGQ